MFIKPRGGNTMKDSEFHHIEEQIINLLAEYRIACDMKPIVKKASEIALKQWKDVNKL